MGDNMYTVYMHKNKTNGKVYIGITGKKPEVRWSNGTGYSKSYFANAIKKYGWDGFEHIILFTGLSKEEACEKEKELIRVFNSTSKEQGYNIATGGEVNCGYKISDERKKHLSEINTGEKHPQYGKHRSKATKEKIASSHKGIVFSAEHRKKLSDAKKGKPAHNRKRVKQFDLSMNFLKEFDSLETAQNELHINKSNICRAIKYGRTAGGFKWTY